MSLHVNVYACASVCMQMHDVMPKIYVIWYARSLYSVRAWNAYIRDTLSLLLKNANRLNGAVSRPRGSYVKVEWLGTFLKFGLIIDMKS